ncbi:hypothetical protein [Azorhizobium doebereinerae]|uniref:hypothetical protein n=1 Tax=Azorhizobium doebereinerae TaxID=281091 RepID=UPI0003F69F4B|nr:hypothetical protein [Azorhizobium doebereinerae]
MPGLDALISNPVTTAVAYVVVALLGVFLGLWRKWSVNTELRHMVEEQQTLIADLETALDLERSMTPPIASQRPTFSAISLGGAVAAVVEQMPLDEAARRAAAAAELRQRANRLVSEALGFLKEAEAFERNAPDADPAVEDLRAAE